VTLACSVFDDFLSCGPDHRHRHARQVVPNREPALKVPAAPGNFHWTSPLDAHVREDYVHGTEEVSAMVYSSTGPMRGIGGVFGVAGICSIDSLKARMRETGCPEKWACISTVEDALCKQTQPN
jgi:hypothetical protein